MATGNNSGAGELNFEMNVTPLIDVLLVLLIIFMVIAPVAPRGLAAQVPQLPTNPNQNPDAAIVVQIHSARGGQLLYKINEEDVSISDLGNRLDAIFSARADKAMFIQADDDLEFSAVAQVVDLGKVAGADHIGLLTPGNDL
jgi:biopolymer transport protein TolR